ncbi:MAG: SGNH/GDSL hydrolase family protein [Proteobacteria bacterium]|nr:SGNH/GDSL hydrolase family protein [Pseudomonadota bacterium]
MKHCISKFALALVMVWMSAAFLGCGAGTLMSVDPVTDADDNGIVNVGDSIFALSGDIYSELENKSGETWRHYAISGAQSVGGILADPIPDQYANAKSDDPNIRVVYMDGGGNDILIPAIMLDPYSCKNCNYWWCGDLSRSCKNLIDDIYVATVDLLNQMDNDGVEQVVFLGYYHLKWGLLGDLRQLDDAIDYGDKRLKDACTNSTVNAVFVDPRSAFEGKESNYIIVDGIHPTAQGSAVLANLLWNTIDY